MSKWVEKSNQDGNMEVNYDTQCCMKEVAEETARRGLMSY